MRARRNRSLSARYGFVENIWLAKHVVVSGWKVRDGGSTPPASTSLRPRLRDGRRLPRRSASARRWAGKSFGFGLRVGNPQFIHHGFGGATATLVLIWQIPTLPVASHDCRHSCAFRDRRLSLRVPALVLWFPLEARAVIRRNRIVTNIIPAAFPCVNLAPGGDTPGNLPEGRINGEIRHGCHRWARRLLSN